MKKVLILCNSCIGLYKFRKELIETLLEEKFEVYVSTPYDDFEIIEKLKKMNLKLVEINIDRRGINPLKDFKLLKKYYFLLKKIKPNLVLTYTIKPNIYGGIISQILHIPYAANITGLGSIFQKKGFLKNTVSFLYKIALKNSKVVFFENKENKKILLEEKIVKKEQACLLPGAGVNLNEYPLCEYPSDKEIRFLFIGRIMKEKGVEELFEVAKRIKKEYSKVFFDIVGPMEEDYSSYLNILVKRKVINYYGYQKDVKPFIKKCHCFILPSWHEGMANVNLESASMGKPIITSDISGCREAVENGVTGFTFKKKNEDELYEVIKKMIELNFEKRRNMGLLSRKRMEEFFDRKKVIEKTIECLFNK